MNAGSARSAATLLFIERITKYSIAAILCSLSAAAWAQTRTITVKYAPAGLGTSDGYTHASVQVRYALLNCTGEITIAAERVRGSVSVSQHYWFDGDQVAASIAPAPVAPLVSFRGRVLSGGSLVGTFAIEAGDALAHDCWGGDTQIIAPLSRFVGKNADIRAFLDSLSVDVDPSPKPLANATLAGAVRAERQAAKQREAAAQEEQARTEREAQEKRAQADREAQERRAGSQDAAAGAQGPARGRTLGAGASETSATSSSTSAGAEDPARGKTADAGASGASGAPSSGSAGAPAEKPRQAAAEDAEARRQQAEARVAMLERQRQARETRRAVAETNRKIDDMAQSFYAARSVDRSRSDVREITNLQGNYASAQELEREYQHRVERLNQELRNLEAAGQAQLQAETQLHFGDADPAIGAAAGMIAGMIASAEREKQAREARQRLDAQRQRMLAEIEARRRQMTIQMRRDLLSRFPDGNVPLSSHKVDAPLLYFFSYTCDAGAIEQPAPALVVSNTFAVQRRADGTWPFKNSINRDLRRLAPGQNTLMGYYASRDLAESMRASFMKLARQTSFRITDIEYGGRVSAGDTPAATDFWSGQKADQPDSAAQQPADFWE